MIWFGKAMRISPSMFRRGPETVVRKVIIEIKGEDAKDVESLEQLFSDAFWDYISDMGFSPRLTEDGETTGVVELWGCTVEERS